MKRYGRSIMVVSTAVVLLVAFVACAPAYKSDVRSQAAEGITVSQETLEKINGGDNAQWAKDYPDQYFSYLSGVGEVEPSITKDSDIGDVHSHATLRANMIAYGGQNGQIPYLETSGASCISCKSVYFSKLYDEMGMDAFSVSYADIKDKYAYWDCLNCHKEEPGDAIGGQLVLGETLTRSFPTKLTDKDLACAQCHNSLTPYSMVDGINGKAAGEGKTLADIDPYRYGVDPDGLMKAELEDGAQLTTDEVTGLQTFYIPLADIEIYEGGTHQSMGLNCVDCHMPAMKSEGGSAYTSHNASQSPLENEAAVEKCLTCHANQGISGADQMRDWVREKQATLGTQEIMLENKLTQIEDLMVAAVVSGKDGAVFDKIRDNYLHAKLYHDYARSAVESPGQKIAHNSESMTNYVERGLRLADEAIALL